MYTPISELVGKDISGLDYIWGMNFDQTIILVEHDLDNAGRFVVTYVEGGKEYQHDNVHPIREAFRDNTDELTAKLTTVLELVRKVVSGRRLLNIGERQATLEAWYENNPNVTNEYREAEAALDTLAALLASLDAGENPPTEET